MNSPPTFVGGVPGEGSDGGEGGVAGSVVAKPGEGRRDRTAEPLSRWELPAVALLALVSMVAVTLLSRRLWFLDDSWDFLTGRSLTDFSSWMEPHAGHWQSTTVIAYQALKGIVGLDFWPWYYVPRIVGYAGLCVLLWWVLRRRGTEPVVAFGALAIFLFLGSSGWQNLSTFNAIVILGALYLVGVAIAEHDHPGVRLQLWVFGLLAFALVTSSLAIAVAAGVGVALLVTGRLRAWLPALLGAGAVYGAWWLAYGKDHRETPAITFEAIRAIPRGIYDVFDAALPSTFSLPDAFGPVLVALAVAALVVLALRRALDVFDIALLASLVVFLALVVVARIHPGRAAPDAERYVYFVAFLFVPVLLPHVKPGPRPWIRAGALVVLLAIAAGNLVELRERLDWWEDRARGSRAVVETTAVLLAAGEPALPAAAVDSPRSGALTMTRLQELLDWGWSPSPPLAPVVVEESRARMRMSFRADGRVRGVRLRADTDLDGQCTVVDEGTTLVTTVAGTGTVGFTGEPGSAAELTWSDRFGVASRTLTFADNFAGGAFVTVADPVPDTTLSVAPQGGAVEVCGVVRP